MTNDKLIADGTKRNEIVAELEKCDNCRHGVIQQTGGNPMSGGYTCARCALRRRAAFWIQQDGNALRTADELAAEKDKTIAELQAKLEAAKKAIEAGIQQTIQSNHKVFCNAGLGKLDMCSCGKVVTVDFLSKALAALEGK